MEPGKLIRGLYVGRFEKRRAGRMGVAGTASADFLTPAGLRITNISRGGVGLSGVVRVGTRDSGLVRLYLPGSYELTTAVAQVAWSDRQGHVGLKFIQLQTIADEWKPWFAGSDQPEGESSAASGEGTGASGEVLASLRTTGPATGAAAAAAPAAETPNEAEAPYDLRKELATAAPRRAWLRVIRRTARAVLILLLIAAAALAGSKLWLRRAEYWSAARSLFPSEAAAPEDRPSAEAAAATPKTAARSKAPSRFLTQIQIVEGQPVLEPERRSAKPDVIERGKPISRPGPVYPASVVPRDGEEVGLLLRIDEKGTVNEVKVVRGDPRLAEAAAAAAGHWRYTPFVSNSAPVNVQLPVTIKFQRIRLPEAAHR